MNNQWQGSENEVYGASVKLWVDKLPELVNEMIGVDRYANDDDRMVSAFIEVWRTMNQARNSMIKYADCFIGTTKKAMRDELDASKLIEE